jgi:hypothetical protein
MKISKYLGYILKDFFAAYGCLMVSVVIYLGIYSVETISTSLLFQIILAASAYTFFKFALVNKYELGKKAQMISFSICFVMGDVMVLIWLWFFSPGKIMDKNLIIIYFIIILVVKGAVYAMMYIDGQTQAKKLNEKLRDYKYSEIE